MRVALVAASLLALSLATAAPVSAATADLASDEGGWFCKLGDAWVDGEQVADGWVLCCDGDGDEPLTWTNCRYGGWGPVIPPV